MSIWSDAEREAWEWDMNERKPMKSADGVQIVAETFVHIPLPNGSIRQEKVYYAFDGTLMSHSPCSEFHDRVVDPSLCYSTESAAAAAMKEGKVQ